VASLLVLTSVAYAQQAPNGDDEPNAQGTNTHSDPGVMTLHTGTHLVILDVVVTDKKGHTVSGLSQEMFHIAEDGEPQTVKFFEEHAPVDPELVAKQKAELAAKLPVNTFTNYEPFTGGPITILLLNKLSDLPAYDIEPLRQQMLRVIEGAPQDSPFAIFQLDTELRLVQPVTTNRGLLIAAVNQMWLQPQFGVPPAELGLSPPAKSKPYSNADVVLARREIFTAAMEQLSTNFGPGMGRKTLFAFTGGIRCALSSAWDCSNGSGPDITSYFCGLIDGMEQARISMYRYYPDGQVVYGFGCKDAPASLRDVFDTNAHYYTFYYTPTNESWSGKYRKLRVAIADDHLHLSYRAGYYGREENAKARHDAGGAGMIRPNLVAIDSTGQEGTAIEPSDAQAAPSETPKGAPNPLPIVFTVRVEPATASGAGPQVAPPSPGNPESEADRLKGYRDYTLHFVIPAAGVRLRRELHDGEAPGQSPYRARLEIAAVSYVRGHPADAKTIQVSADFTGPTDPRIAQGVITASLTLQVPEKGSRLLHLTVRDGYTGQFSRLDIPLEKITLPAR